MFHLLKKFFINSRIFFLPIIFTLFIFIFIFLLIIIIFIIMFRIFFLLAFLLLLRIFIFLLFYLDSTYLHDQLQIHPIFNLDFLFLLPSREEFSSSLFHIVYHDYCSSELLFFLLS